MCANIHHIFKIASTKCRNNMSLRYRFALHIFILIETVFFMYGKQMPNAQILFIQPSVQSFPNSSAKKCAPYILCDHRPWDSIYIILLCTYKKLSTVYSIRIWLCTLVQRTGESCSLMSSYHIWWHRWYRDLSPVTCFTYSHIYFIHSYMHGCIHYKHYRIYNWIDRWQPSRE